MDEWQRTVASTTAGFIAGVVAEPIKMWIANRKKQSDLRKAIYDELSTITGRMAAFLQYAESHPDPKELQWGLKTFELNPVPFDIFEHYYDRERALVFSLPEARWVAHLYRVLKRLNDEACDDAAIKAGEIRKGLKHIYAIALNGAIPARTLNKLARSWTDGQRPGVN